MSMKITSGNKIHISRHKSLNLQNCRFLKKIAVRAQKLSFTLSSRDHLHKSSRNQNNYSIPFLRLFEYAKIFDS
jgi:hypothetical protein